MNMFDDLNVIFVGIFSTVPYGSGSHFNFRKSQEQVKNRSTKCQEQGGIKIRKIKNSSHPLLAPYLEQPYC